MQAIVATFYGGMNYGSRLQASALRDALRRYGCEVSFLREFTVIPFLLRHPTLLLARMERYLTLGRRKKFFKPLDYTPSQRKLERLSQYEIEHTPSVDIDSLKKWRELVDANTVFIGGSDIIWNPWRGYPTKHFLDFAVVAGLPCFSYASSVGVQEIPRRYHHAFRRYIGSYLRVGVRESSVVKMLEPIVGRKIEQVVDPTLLMTDKEWDAYADRAELSVTPNPGGFIVAYFVMDDPRYWRYVELVQKELELPAIVLPMHATDGVNQGWDRVEDATPYEFVWLIKHAAAVVTDSFHACSFCLTYEKEFYLLRRTRKSEDSKYDDFLARYALEDRIVRDESCFVRVPPHYTAEIRGRLASDRERSLQFLREALDETSDTVR